MFRHIAEARFHSLNVAVGKGDRSLAGMAVADITGERTEGGRVRKANEFSSGRSPTPVIRQVPVSVLFDQHDLC